jgi:hypothetical protein
VALGAYSKNFADGLSFTSNQAVLGSLKTLTAGVYAERRFLLKELNLYTVAASFPIQFGGVGLVAKYFGYESFKETELSLAYGKQLGKTSIGIQFNYYSVQIPGYGKDALVNIEGGAILQLSEQLYAGLHVFNPTKSRFGKNHLEKLSSVYASGLGYEASQKVFVCVEILKEEDRAASISAGLHYAFAKKFFARLGLSTGSNSFYFGTGWKWSNLRIEVTSNYHSRLGFTPGLLLLFRGNNQEE